MHVQHLHQSVNQWEQSVVVLLDVSSWSVCLWVCVCARARQPMLKKWPQAWHRHSPVRCFVFTHVCVPMQWRKMPQAHAVTFLWTPPWEEAANDKRLSRVGRWFIGWRGIESSTINVFIPFFLKSNIPWILLDIFQKRFCGDCVKLSLHLLSRETLCSSNSAK